MLYKDLVPRFLDIYNQSMMLHRDTSPYKYLLSTTEPLFGGKKWGISVYDTDPTSLRDFYTLEYSDHKFSILEHGNTGAEYIWKVPEAYLRKVINNSRAYLDHPKSLDWEWLIQRINIS